MFVRLLALTLCAGTFAGCLSVRGTVVTTNSAEPPVGMLRHIVLFKFVPGTPPDKVHAVEEAFRALDDRIDTVKAFEYGVEMSGRNLSKGFTHGGMFTFVDEAGRDVYRDHPAHVEFVGLTKGIVEEIFVYDYWVRD